MRSMVIFVAFAGASLLGVSASRALPFAAGNQADDEAAVLDALDRYMTAISESDFQAQSDMQMPEGMSYQWRPAEGGGMRITVHPNAWWSDPAREDGRTFRERYWTPTVMIRGGIAVVWAPYEFWIDGETSHCGVDVIDFVKIDDRWMVSNAMWTVEPDACGELRPADPAGIRPKDEPQDQ